MVGILAIYLTKNADEHFNQSTSVSTKSYGCYTWLFKQTLKTKCLVSLILPQAYYREQLSHMNALHHDHLA